MVLAVLISFEDGQISSTGELEGLDVDDMLVVELIFGGLTKPLTRDIRTVL